MAKTIGEHIRGNVVAYIALFVSLGGSAYAVTALDKNSVKSKHIVNGQVKERDTRNGHFAPGPKDCPNGTRLVEAACIERTVRPADATYVDAQTACRNAGRRLPSVAELQSLRLRGVTLGRTGGFPQELTSEIDYTGGDVYAQVVDSSGRTDGWVTTAQPFRCVAVP